MPGTSEWIFETDEFEKWINATSDSSPILWLSGAPGTGKSVLCSRVIQHIREIDPSAAIAFHFFRFDHQRTSTIEVLRVLAIQLLEKLRASIAELPETVLAITQKSPNNHKNVIEITTAITSSLFMTKSFIFIDGLDEEMTGRPMNVSLETLDSLISVASSGGTIRLWLSSQQHAQIAKRMVPFPRIHFSRQNEADIMLFFERHLPQLDDLSADEEEKNRWLTSLKNQSKGNFL